MSKYKPHTERLKRVDQYIRELFEDELPGTLKYHSPAHTLHPTKGVAAIASKLSLKENISEGERELVVAAAYFHDTGFVREYEKNEPIAARMAGRIFKLVGYRPEEIRKIQAMILTTDLDVEPKTHLEMILCDADLDNLGRKDFMELDAKLREGRRLRGVDVSDDASWYRGTLKFLQKHRYYTDSQQKCREKGKQENIGKLLDLLEALETGGY
jgi:predicted metal-dependent HD superfamily phosphohydrolase